MTEYLGGWFGKIVIVTMKDGKRFVGEVYDYTSALNNIPPKQSITVKDNGICFDLYENEIATIEEAKG